MRQVGVTAIDSSTAAPAVSTVEPLTTARVALTKVEVPVGETGGGRAQPPGGVMVATEVVADAQVTVPVQVLGRAVGIGTGRHELSGFTMTTTVKAGAGITAIDSSTAALAVSTVEPLMSPSVAVIEVIPSGGPQG